MSAKKKIGVLGSGVVGQTLAGGFVKHGFETMIGSREPGKLADLVLGRRAFFGAKPSMIVKGGMIAAAPMGDPNASIPTPQPVHYRPMFATYGGACRATSVSFVSQAALANAALAQLGLAPPTVAHAAEALWDCPVEEIYGSSETGMRALRRGASGPSWTLCEGLSFTSADGATQVRGGHLDAPFTLTDRIELEGERSFRLLGRIGDMIKVAGKRASLEDLNARLRAVPGVHDGVFYMPDGGARPVAFAVAPGSSKASILEALRRDIDPVFLPRPLYLVDELPRTANGKITRDGLEALRRRVLAR